MSKSLGRIVGWAHELIAENLQKGQLALDLTAGNGYDALFLHRLVGPSGQVVAFDIQPQALENTRQRLVEQGALVRMRQSGEAPLQVCPGVDLVAAGHETLKDFLPGAPQGVLANLGYLPGGDPQLITRPESTLQALRSASDLLAPGGRMAVVVYTGHPGGAEEGEQVAAFFSGLDETSFQVLQLKVANRSQAPFLLVAEKSV